MYRSSLNPPDHPNFRHTNWAKFQACLEDEILINLDLHNGLATDTSVENLSSTIMKALPASTPKSCPHDDPRSPIPAGIQDVILLKNWLRRQWQFTRDPALKAEVSRLQRSVTHQLNELRNDQWSETLESLEPQDQSLSKLTKQEMRVRTPSPPGYPAGVSLSRTQRKPKPWLTVCSLLSFS